MKKVLFSLLGAACIAYVPVQLFAQQAPAYVLDKKIALPGDGGYDYLSIDAQNRRLYVSHGTAVNVIDLNTEQPVGTIADMKGVHGIAIDNEHNKGFISDGRANAVVVFDLKTLKTITTIAISGKGPDAITYDAASKRVFTFNGESNNTTVIDAVKLKEISSVSLGGAPEFAVVDGKGTLYVNLEDKNSLVAFNTKTLKVVATHPLAPCGGPTGLAIDTKNGCLFSVCRENKGMSVVNIATGKVITTLPIGAGVDAVAYDAATKLIFVSNGDGTTNIFKQESATKYTALPTLTTQYRAKTLALDAKTNKIYLSVADFEKGSKKSTPGTFKVLVYKPQ